MFHPRCGSCVILSNGNKMATRTNPTQEFNKGLIFSFEPIKDNELFEVKIEKKLNTWSGSIEIGVTVSNPDIIETPTTATDLKGGTWIMLGQGVFRDGLSLHEAYGCDLDKLVEGDKVGVMRTSQGDLKFFVNGNSQGVACSNLPSMVYAVVDMYGKCAQVTLTSPTTPDSVISNHVDEDSVEDIGIIKPPSSNYTEEMSCEPQPLESLKVPLVNSDIRPLLAPTASEEASLTEATCSGSALTNHIVNIGIANSLLLANDSNLLEDEKESNRDDDDEEGATAHVPFKLSNDAEVRVNGREDPHRRQNDVENLAASERLRFHDKAGILVKLTNGGRTAERKRPMDEFNNGVVMSNRAIKINELFEIRIDRLVDKWSGSIEVGVTTHNPNMLEFPATMTSMRSGTIMMSGSSILTNGKGTVREYGCFNLDELKEGDRIGMMIKDGRDLLYYINGMEQGIAASNVPTPVWAVVDLYGMTVKVTLVDREDRKERNLITWRKSTADNNMEGVSGPNNYEEPDPLLFHPNCGTYANVINRGRTALRPNAADDFNNGVVLTQRPLNPNEMFEVQLDRLVDKWAGSLEIGVTTHIPTELEFPSTMTNVRSGTWLMTSNGVTHNGTTVIDTYGLNLDRLKVGQRIGVCRQDDSSLHFYIDGVDQGIAAISVPQNVYGVVDLYGQAAQVTVCNPSDILSQQPDDALACNSSNSLTYNDLRFHHLHGRNARIIRGGLVAQRPNANGEFNDAIVMSSRQLHEGEMFEVRIDKMVDRWSGSLEAGVTAIAPEQIDFPSTMTDIDYETWMLSGSSVMRNGVTIMNNYPCDLDSLGVGTRIGMQRHSDGSLHYYVNGEDQGAACSNLDSGLWAVIDLYGQCAQVSIVHNIVRLVQSMLTPSQYIDVSHISVPIGDLSSGTETLHRWSKCCGSNVVLSSNQTVATRIRHFNHGLIFSSHPLETEEIFEVCIEKVNTSFSGSLRVGLTSLAINDTFPSGALPSSLSGIESCDTWWIDGSSVRKNGNIELRLNFCSNLNRLQVGDKIGLRRSADGVLRVTINGEDFGPAAYNVTKKRVFAVVELFGSAESVSITSFCKIATPGLEGPSTAIVSPLVQQPTNENTENVPALETPIDVAQEGNDQNTFVPFGNETLLESGDQEDPVCFHESRGRNIQLSADRTVAVRLESYNQGIVLSSKPLPPNSLFQVHTGALQTKWSSSLLIGVTTQSPDKLHLPNSAFDLKKNTWLICGDSVFYNGTKIKGRYGPNLDHLSGNSGGHLIGVLVDGDCQLHLFVNGVDQGVAAREIPSFPYCIVDLYGQCQEVVISGSINSDTRNNRRNMKHQQHSHNHNLNLQQQQQQQHPHMTPLLNEDRPQQRIDHLESLSAKEDKAKNPSDPFPANPLIKNCEYQNLCSRFKASLSLPEAYFSLDGNVCFCETCHKVRGDESFPIKGPLKQPLGWCLFSLGASTAGNNESWHMAYHGTQPGSIRKMLDKGELLFPSDLGVNSRLPNRKNKDDISDGSVLYFSPSIVYASSDHFIARTTFIDGETHRRNSVKTVLQVAIEPDSYKVGPPTFPWDAPPPLGSANDTIEWVTKERNTTQLLALLIRIEAK